jgi:EAL domain-containing protein (putative c-di-GMP-specific phosphodiesterase class I)
VSEAPGPAPYWERAEELRHILEVTEKYAIENYTMFEESLEEFTKVGFRIAVDDVGAGHSGMDLGIDYGQGFLLGVPVAPAGVPTAPAGVPTAPALPPRTGARLDGP